MYFSPSGFMNRLMSEYMDAQKITVRAIQAHAPKPSVSGAPGARCSDTRRT